MLPPLINISIKKHAANLSIIECRLERSSKHNYSLPAHSVFTQDWLNFYWLSCLICLIFYITMRCSWMHMFITSPSRNLHKYKHRSLHSFVTHCYLYICLHLFFFFFWYIFVYLFIYFLLLTINQSTGLI